MNKDIGRIISILSNQLKRHIDTNAAIHGYTGVQGRILNYIMMESAQRELFQKDIEEEFGMRCSTATGILKLLEKNGLLKRVSVPYDARLKKIIVTELGMQKRELIMQDICSIEEKLRNGISPQDLNTFQKVMEQLSKNLEQ